MSLANDETMPMSLDDTDVMPSQSSVIPNRPVGGLPKRLFDIAGSTALIALLGPAMIIGAAVIYLQDRGAPVFAHERVGYGGRSFKCLKFRSMVLDSAEALECHLAANPSARLEWQATHKLKDDPRITGLGHFLRKSSFDELPQLFNVLRGDMSLVGPRPVVHAEVSRYGNHFADYAGARPGITGLWQVGGRSDLDYDARVKLDSAYVRSWSLTGDIAILIRTVGVVFSRKGSY